MKFLMIGGTGTISSAITRQLAESGHDLWLLNPRTDLLICLMPEKMFVYLQKLFKYNKLQVQPYLQYLMKLV